jgi:hypothetical protein
MSEQEPEERPTGVSTNIGFWLAMYGESRKRLEQLLPSGHEVTRQLAFDEDGWHMPLLPEDSAPRRRGGARPGAGRKPGDGVPDEDILAARSVYLDSLAPDEKPSAEELGKSLALSGSQVRKRLRLLQLPLPPRASMERLLGMAAALIAVVFSLDAADGKVDGVIRVLHICLRWLQP